MLEPADYDLKSWSGIASLRADCESVAVSEGLAGVELFFRGQDLFTDVLDRAPSYRDRHKEWKAKQIKSEPNPLVLALESIAAGHNDPRTLARDVLSSHYNLKEPDA